MQELLRGGVEAGAQRTFWVMVFTDLPRQVASFAQTKHAELVAVVGRYERDTTITVGIGDDQLHYAIETPGQNRDQASEIHIWRWAAKKASLEGKRRGRLFAVSRDGLVITTSPSNDRKRQPIFLVWNDDKLARTIGGHEFGIHGPTGEVIHGKLALASPVAGLGIFDLASGKKLNTLDAPTHDAAGGVDDHDKVHHTVAEAPDGGIAINDGTKITIRDLSTMKTRASIAAPEDLELRRVAVSPDGAWVVASTVARKKWTVGSTGFAVFDVRKKKLAKILKGHGPYTRNAIFCCGGRVLVSTSTDRTIRLWETGTWKLLEILQLENSADDPRALHAWDAHDAIVLTGNRGLAYVFQIAVAPRAAAVEPAKVERRAKPPAPARLPKELPPARWPERGWRFSPGKKGEDQLGGVPAGFTDASWPICAACDHPMIAALTLRAHPERLPLRAHAALSIFVCKSCETSRPYEGTNAARLVTADALAHHLARPPDGIEGRTAIITSRALVYTREAPRRGEATRIFDKVGGAPDWLQSDETPVCKTCKAKMKLAAQFSDGLDELLNFGCGFGFAFVCPSEHDARFLWQR